MTRNRLEVETKPKLSPARRRLRMTVRAAQASRPPRRAAVAPELEIASAKLQALQAAQAMKTDRQADGESRAQTGAASAAPQDILSLFQ